MSKQTDPGTHTTDYPMNRKAFLCLALFLGAGYPLLSLLNIFYISVESNVLFSGSVGANILWVFTNLFAALFFFVTFGTMIAVLWQKADKTGVACRHSVLWFADLQIRGRSSVCLFV